MCDDSGALSLWQVGMNTPAVTKPYWVSRITRCFILDHLMISNEHNFVEIFIQMNMDKNNLYKVVYHHWGDKTLVSQFLMKMRFF